MYHVYIVKTKTFVCSVNAPNTMVACLVAADSNNLRYSDLVAFRNIPEGW